MHKIEVEKSACLYLHHQELITAQYKQHVEAEYRYYTLKPELFNFKPKVAVLAKNSIASKNNRKRKAETETEASKECEQIKLLIQPFLKEIKNLSKHKNKSLQIMPRLWEETTEFPQFRGANNTAEFQTTQFHNNTYIIPPKSKFYNYNVDQLPQIIPELERYDMIIMDMPWQNKYIKRLKKVKQSLAYKMLDNDNLKNIPIQELIHPESLVALWCTNAMQHRRAIEEDFLPNWNLQLIHTLKWFKVNTEGELISTIKSEGYKQPYELLYIACHKERCREDLEKLKEVDFLASVPSIIHSHKPPVSEWLKKYLKDCQQFKGLEIFARYLQPQFTSIGLEVLKLMDIRLYNKNT